MTNADVTTESERRRETIFFLAGDGSLWEGRVRNGEWSELAWDRLDQPFLPQETDAEDLKPEEK